MAYLETDDDDDDDEWCEQVHLRIHTELLSPAT
jgi:hypothetical protein